MESTTDFNWQECRRIKLPPLESEAGEDRLERHQIISVLSETIRFAECPCAIGLDGEWGSGKTFLLRLLKQHLEEDGYPVIWFDIWKYEAVQNPIYALANEVLESSGLKRNEKIAENLIDAATWIGNKTVEVAPILGDSFLGRLSKKILKTVSNTLKKRWIGIRSAEKAFDEAVSRIIEKASDNKPDAKRKLVILIDDLDRCFPEQVTSLINAVKHYFISSKCLFVIAMDKRRVVESINFQKHISGDDNPWLEKLFTFEIKVPAPEERSVSLFVYHAIRNRINELEITNWASSILRGELEKTLSMFKPNPRRWNRLISETLIYILDRYPYQKPELGKEQKYPEMDHEDRLCISILALKNFAPLYLSIIREYSNSFLLIRMRFAQNDTTFSDHSSLRKRISDLVQNDPDRQYIKRYMLEVLTESDIAKDICIIHAFAALNRIGLV